MKLTAFLPLAVVIAIACAFTAPALAQSHDPAGIWLGELKVGAMVLRLQFNITRKNDTAFSATMDSPDQGAKGIPVGSVRLTGDSLILGMPALLGKYSGVFRGDSIVDGIWHQAGRNFLLALKRANAGVEVRRPQTPAPPFPYTSEEVTFRNEKENFSLAGTLTLPKGEGPFPGVVFISGSGPQDRDETIFNHKPFLVLADHLTRNGIAVLRYDDRGVGESKGSSENARSDNLADDAAGALAFLRARHEIDTRRTGLLGHSEGGMIAPILAARTKDVAFVVLLSGPGVPGDEILLRQGELIRRAEHVSEQQIEAQTKIAKTLYSIIRSTPDTAAAYTKMMEALNMFADELPDSIRHSPDFSREQLSSSARSLNSPWFRYFLTYDPRPALRALKIPVLALNGELDLQVPASENIAAIESALREGGNTRVTTKIFPKLNHLFQTSVTGSVSEYAKIEETMAPEVIDTITQWLLALR